MKEMFLFLLPFENPKQNNLGVFLWSFHLCTAVGNDENQLLWNFVDFSTVHSICRAVHSVVHFTSPLRFARPWCIGMDFTYDRYSATLAFIGISLLHLMFSIFFIAKMHKMCAHCCHFDVHTYDKVIK